LVVPKLDRLARSVPDARAIGDARANGKLKGKQPKLSSRQRVHVLKLAGAGDHTTAELAELFSVSRATIYREIGRARGDPT
jgi:DNA invertase Pin-like site-specific DNA recombinase